MSKNALAAFLSAATILAPAGHAAAQSAGNDYPTEAIADYVFGCMKANGETRQSLTECSCSVDVVATLLPYTRYEEASTFLSMVQVGGEKSALFRETPESRAAITDLRRAQAEAEIRCFRSG